MIRLSASRSSEVLVRGLFTAVSLRLRLLASAARLPVLDAQSSGNRMVRRSSQMLDGKRELSHDLCECRAETPVASRALLVAGLART